MATNHKLRVRISPGTLVHLNDINTKATGSKIHCSLHDIVLKNQLM